MLVLGCAVQKHKYIGAGLDEICIANKEGVAFPSHGAGLKYQSTCEGHIHSQKTALCASIYTIKVLCTYWICVDLACSLVIDKDCPAVSER